MTDVKNNKYRILFVCLGNICRSPAGEGIMQHIVSSKNLQERIEIESAGTSGYHNGELPDQRMRNYGAKRGYKFDSLSRKFMVNDFDKFDLIITMDDNNFNNITRLSPDLESKEKIHRMVEFSQKYSRDHIPDPYYMGDEGFDLVLNLLEDACQGLMKHIEDNKII